MRKRHTAVGIHERHTAKAASARTYRKYELLACVSITRHEGASTRTHTGYMSANEFRTRCWHVSSTCAQVQLVRKRAPQVRDDGMSKDHTTRRLHARERVPPVRAVRICQHRAACSLVHMLHEGASTSAGNIGRTAETAPSCCCGRAPDTTEASRRYSHVGAHGYVRAVIDSTVDGRQRTTALLRSTSTRSPGYEPAVTKSGHAWRRHRGAEADARPQMRGRTWLTGLGAHN